MNTNIIRLLFVFVKRLCVFRNVDCMSRNRQMVCDRYFCHVEVMLLTCCPCSPRSIIDYIFRFVHVLRVVIASVYDLNTYKLFQTENCTVNPIGVISIDKLHRLKNAHESTISRVWRPHERLILSKIRFVFVLMI